MRSTAEKIEPAFRVVGSPDFKIIKTTVSAFSIKAAPEPLPGTESPG